MANTEFYVVYINRRKDVTYAALEEKMNLSHDWYRINENLWILCTTSDEDKWYARLSSLVKETGRLFICKLDMAKRQGWMDKSFWKWVRREKET